MDYAPYVKYDVEHPVNDKLYSSHRGILDTFIEQMIHDVCNGCAKVGITFTGKNISRLFFRSLLQK